MAITGLFSPSNISNEFYFTATAGQTVFAARYVPGLVEVYKNGLKLISGTDFTATNGTTVTLASGAALNDKIDVVCYPVSLLDDVIERAEMTSTFLPRSGHNLSNTYVPWTQGRHRNLIINPKFQFWQRMTSRTGGGYTADRWVTSVVGNTVTTSSQAFSIGQTDVPDGPQYYCQVANTSVAGANNYTILYQEIEDVMFFSNTYVTLTFYAKATTTGKQVSVELARIYGTGGTPSSADLGLGGIKFDLTTSWQKFTHTTWIPTIAGRFLGTNADDSLRMYFWFDCGSSTSFQNRSSSLPQQTGTFHIANVSLVLGENAGKFEFRPDGEELRLCQRYFEMSPGTWTNLISTDVTSGEPYYRHTRYQVRKRSSTHTVSLTNLGQNRFGTTPNLIGQNTGAFWEQRTATSTGGNGYFGTTWTADAEI